ncbi:uncharacterized protein LOC114522645 isoform X2 [Dendronephthya gigantea]|uniref:uncharacterized protein LOC114522645 isoform X2 n=1 Tax=Dendronephthya gigantea TaxID=151771 RepID=UPI00106D3342|nr:uncharacterized protein LOC114522645 isoform X2 [Dendronephthya gigantea]
MYLWTYFFPFFFLLFYLTDAVTYLEIYPGQQCSYNYDLEVHTHRGERSTKELNIKINAKVNLEVLDRYMTENDGYVTKLELRHPRVIRSKGGRTIKHVVDHNLEKKLSRPFFFVQSRKGEVTHVFYPHDDSEDLIGMKKGVVSAFHLKLHPDLKIMSFNNKEEDDSGIHVTYYDVNYRNTTHSNFTKQWSGNDYLKHADGRPVEGKKHVKSRYDAAVKIEDNVIKSVKRTHFSQLHNEKHFKRPLTNPDFQKQPNLSIKASGESKLDMLSCSQKPPRRERSVGDESLVTMLADLKQDSLTHADFHRLHWSKIGNPEKPTRTFYELLRCNSDISVKKHELLQCIKELHYLARTDNETYRTIAELTLSRSHQNFSTWSGLVGALVVKGDYETQKALSQALLSEYPRPLSDREHSILLEAVFFIPLGPLYPELLQALLSLHKNNSKSEEVTVRAMLVMSGLVRRVHEAGYNRSLSDDIAQYLHQSFKTHPARVHDDESESRETYLRNHIWAFGNLGHSSSLNTIVRYLDHDSSGIRYSAVSALRNLPFKDTEHHLLRALKHDEHVTVKAGVIEVFLERRQNISDDMREGIEDALWSAKEGDELDSKITEFLDKHGDQSHHTIKKLRKRRAAIKRKKRALIPALKPKEFSLGPRREWKKGFGGSKAGAEAMMSLVNQVRLQIGLFGGKFEVDVDNLALLRAHVFVWSYEVLRGKAAFKMSARFKNDIPKDLIHTISDTADDILAAADSITSIFTKHIQNFIDKLKNYVPLDSDAFLGFITKAAEFLKRSVQATRFGRYFSQIARFVKDASRTNGLWQNIASLVKKLSQNLKHLNLLSNGPFEEGSKFLNRIMVSLSKIASELPQDVTKNFNIKDFLKHISGRFDSIGDAAKDYFRKISRKIPDNFLGMLHFKTTLRFLVSLDKFKTVTMRLINFGNTLLEMLSVFRGIIKIELPRPSLPEFGPISQNHRFDFGLSYDWRVKFSFKINFSGEDFQKLRNFFRYLGRIFRHMDGQNIDLQKIFRDFLPSVRNELKSIDADLVRDTKVLNVALWFQEIMKKFDTILGQQDRKLLNFSNTVTFLEELGKEVAKFSKKTLNKVCKFQGFMSQSAVKLEEFGLDLEHETVAAIGRVKDETQLVISEIFNVTSFVDRTINNLQIDLSDMAKKFVNQFLTKLESSLENVKELAENVAEFTTEKAAGFCHKSADFSGEILDNIQSEAENAVKELADFITSNSHGITDFISQFKTVVTNVENWQRKNLQKRLGKFALVAETLDEFLSLLKNENNFYAEVYKVSKNIKDVLKYLIKFPEHADKARQAADKVNDFASNAALWEAEMKKLNIGKKFKLDFDEKLRNLCNEFHTLAQDSVRKIQGDTFFRKFRNFVTKETDALISRAVGKLNLLKEPLTRVQGVMEKISESVSEVEAVLIAMKPFSKHFSPILKEVSELPNCSEIAFIFDDAVAKYSQGAKAFGKQAYDEYKDLRSEVKAFLELLPDEWESLSLRNCVNGGTCLTEAFTKQAQGISKKIKTLQRKLDRKELFESLEPYRVSVEEVSRIVEKVKNISLMVKEYSFNDEVMKIMDLARRITGKYFGEKERQLVKDKKKTVEDFLEKVRSLAHHVKKADDTKEKIEKLVEEVFGKLKSIYSDNIKLFQDNIKVVQEMLSLSYVFSKKLNLFNSSFQAVDRVVGVMTSFTEDAQNIVSPLEGTVLDFLSKSDDFMDIFSGKLKNYGEKVEKTSKAVNAFLDKIISFLNTIQIRQKGLNTRDYKPWNKYAYCSKEVCLRLIRRSTNLYLNTVFLWKYPHLNDLSSFSKTGKWLVPGLFDDYKVRGIAPLSNNEMLLGMRGVAANTKKASLLVVVDIGSSSTKISKIIQLQQDGQPFIGDMGGVAVVKDTLIWITSESSLYAVRVSEVHNSMSTSGPSIINISKTKLLLHQATTLSYDSRDSQIWVVDAFRNNVHSYDVSPFGDVLLLKKTIKTGKHTRGFAIVRQFGVKYAAVAKCALVAGLQCKLEFHSVDRGVLGESTIHRVVRTPTGLEAVQTVDSEHLVTAFSSGTFSEQEKIERIGGDFEDRFFKFKLPILSTGFGITENCVFLKVGGDYIIPAKRLFPIGERHCGKRRKRSALEKVLDADVYTKELEGHKRVRRQTTESVSCIKNVEGVLKKGTLPLAEVNYFIIVYGIPITLYFGAEASYNVNYRISLCLREKEIRFGIIPGVSLSVYAGAKVDLFLVAAGVTVEAKLLETYLIPEIAVRIDKWPLRACLELKMQMTPLTIRIYLWYQLRLRVEVRLKKWFRIRVELRWGRKKTFAEWSWSSPSIHKTLFSNCQRDVDKTPPGVGSCSAKQVGSKKYFVQWHGFTEDTNIQNYVVLIGSIRGSGDDYYLIHEKRQSLLVQDLRIMHGRSVYISVYARNSVGLKSPFAHCPVFTAKRRPPIITFVHDGEASEDIDYQTDATSLAVKYGLAGAFADLASVKWGISSSSKCTLSEDEADVLSMREIGESYTIKKTGLELTSGKMYYTRIYVVSLLGLASVACSDGITVDTTPPVPRNFTVGKDGTGYIPSVGRIFGKFQHFLDSESPMMRYEWKLIDEETGNEVVAFKTIPLYQKSPLLDSLSLIAGKKYTSVLKGTNAAGLYSTVNMSGVIPDDTVPECNGPPDDVISLNDFIDKDFVRQLTNLTVMFSCYDDESGIQSIRAAVGTYPGGDDVYAFVDIGELTNRMSDDLITTWVAFNDINVTSLVRYYVTIKVRNNVGFVKTMSSDGILVDTTEPTVLSSYIRDGYQGIDKRYTSGFDIFPAHWENAFADAESGIGEYFVGLGTSPGTDDQTAFRGNGVKTQVVISSGALKSGVTYYVTVIACNKVGMCVNGTSNGAMVDFIPPNPGTAIAGHNGPPLEITWINKGAWARWQWCPADKAKQEFGADTCDSLSFYDKHSGIKQFGLSVFSYDTAELLVPVKTVGRVVISGLHVVMPNGVFSVVVEAEDRAGVRSNAISESFIVDTTPPQLVKLHHGNENQPVRYKRAQNHVFSAYFEMIEDISAVARYSLGVSSYPGGDDVIPFVTHEPNVTSNVIRVNWTATITTTLKNGRKYYISVKAINSAGLLIVASSPPLIFDNKAPLVARVLDGWGTQDARYHSFATIFRMHWQGIEDSSGIDETKVCLSSTKETYNCDIHPLVKIPNSLLSYSFTNINLQSGTNCYALLQLKDNAGNLGNYWTDGVLVDTSPPVSGRVTDGQNREDVTYQRETNILHASWSGFYDNETSIHHYELGFGTSENISDIQPFTDVGLVTSSASSNLLVSELRNGVKYYARVVGFNTLGIPSKIATSSGVLIDSTPPTFLLPVSDGVYPYPELNYITQESWLAVSWTCDDTDSGLMYTFVGFGTQPGDVDVASYQRVLPYQSSYTLKNISLSHGYRYFATVKCINRVGLQNSLSSDGVTVDSTPPLLGYLNDGTSAYKDVDYIGIGPHVTASWKFIDAESHVTRYAISILQSKNGKRVVGPSEVPGNKRSVQIALGGNELKHGQRYVFSVTAQNGAGLNTTGVSDGFVVDGSAPICKDVYGVSIAGTKTVFIGQTRKLAVHFECGDNETGINEYHFAVKDLNTSQYILPFHKIRGISALSSLAVVDGAGKQIFKLKNGGHYQIGLRATNMVKLAREYWAPGVIVDTTPPVFSKVAAAYRVENKSIEITWKLDDDESGVKTLSWCLNTSPDVENPRNFTKISHNSSKLVISGIPFKLGQTYYVYFKASNKAGRFTLFVSDGVVVDRTPPSTGRVSANFAVPSNYDGNPNTTDGASFTVKWSGFVDQESGVKTYAWAIGSSGEKTKLLGNVFYTKIKFTGSINGYIISGQTVYTNTTYCVCIRVTNGAGLSATSCSNKILVKLGKLTAGVIFDGPLAQDIDFQLDDKAVWLHWAGFKDPVYSLGHYAWCYGPFTTAEQLNCSTSLARVDPPLKTSTHQFHNISLLPGQRYGFEVQASNERGKTVSAVSDGFTVDRTGPLAEGIQVGGSRGTKVIYIFDVTPPIISWTMNERESGIKEYHFGIGGSPKSDDLYSFTKLDGSQHSMNLAEINFNFNHGVSFYITVIGVNVLGLETSMTSPQIIVDWLPPTPGVVRDGNGTSDVDFQANTNHVSATWSEFLDPESDVVEYMYCVGTAPDSCDVTNQTSVNLNLHATAQVSLKEGDTYFVTVTAINGAGLSTTSSSNGFAVDTTPPVIEGFSATSVHTVELNVTNSTDFVVTSILTTPSKISATWDEVYDLESEVKSATLCATTIKDDCDLVSEKSVEPASKSPSLNFPKPLQTGTVFMLKLIVENKAGLVNIAYSSSILVDSTPPLKGTVTIGNENALVFLQEGQFLRASWQGFADPESKINMYEWKVCSASQRSKCVSEFLNARLKTSLILRGVGIDPGTEYNLVIRASNHAELETTAVSNPFILDKTPPESGMVFDGDTYLKDEVYQSSFEQLSVSWKGFQDKESGIIRYEVCIGSNSGLCDVYRFQDVGLTTTALINNLNLTHNETYYTTVRAVNGAGQTSFATSNGIFIDRTPPVGGSLRDGDSSDIDVTLYDSHVSCNWDEFHDVETRVLKYVICAGTVKGSCDILPLTTVNNGLALYLQFKPALSSGVIVYSTLRVYNKAGGLTEVYSDGLLVDSTPPYPGYVKITSPSSVVGDTIYLTSKSAICASWDTFTDAETSMVEYQFSLCLEHNNQSCPIPTRDLNNRTSVCIEEPEITEGQSYVIMITATNKVGLSSSSASPTFIIDTSEPDIGDVVVLNPLGEQYDFVSSAILARWHGFIDIETGIRSYSVCVGTEPSLCDVTNLVTVGNTSSYTWYNLSLIHNEEYFVSIKSINNAGISTNFTTSQPITVDTTAPPLSNVVDGFEETKDIDYQRSRTRVSASWFIAEDPDSGIITLTWCIGSGPRLCDLNPSSSLNVNATKISTFLNQPIKNGESYYVTVKAINGAGLSGVLASNGVTVDYTPPRVGTVTDGIDDDVDYLKSGNTVYARWSEFEDPESGIKSYQFALCEKENVTVCPMAFSDTGPQTNISLSGTELQSGIKYVIIVRAINMVDLRTDATSDGFTVDSTAPVSGQVAIVVPSPSNFEIHQITARWENFMDAESDISQYEVCLGTTEEECDEIDFQFVGSNINHTFTGHELRHQETYYVTVKATNNAGLSTLVSSNQIKVDLTPPSPVEELNGASFDLEEICTNAITERSCNETRPETNERVLIKLSCANDLINASWVEHEDRESGIAMVEWCVESMNNTCNVQLWQALSTDLLSKSAVVHSLSTLTSVRVVLRISNGVGNKAVLESAACYPVKNFPPELNVVEINAQNDSLENIDYQNDSEAIVVTWSPNNLTSYSSVQAALTEPNDELNINGSLRRKWSGEPLAYDFVDIPRERAYIRFSGDMIKPYKKYRPVIKRCNEDGLCTDSFGDGVEILPDAPPNIQVNATDTLVDTEQERWRKFITIPRLSRSFVEDSYFLPDPFSVVIRANLEDPNAFDLGKQQIRETVQASVYRITSGANETQNETIDIRHIFDHLHIHDDANVCCKRRNREPRTVHPDQQIKPVRETTAFGASVSYLKNNSDLIVVSSQNSAYVFSRGSYESTPLTLVTFNSTMNNSFVRVKGYNEILFISGNEKLLLYRIDTENLARSVPILGITNCNKTSTDTIEPCTMDDGWSSSEDVGREFAFDGAKMIAVSGKHPQQGYGVVAIFIADDSNQLELQHVLGSREKDQSFGKAIALNKDFLVIVGAGVYVYSRMSNNSWQNNTALSKKFNNQFPDNIYLTKRNELFLLSISDKTLTVFELQPPGNAIRRCRMVYSTLVQLSGSFDVFEGESSVFAIGIMVDGHDGSDLGVYEPGNRCAKIGRVLTKNGLRSDDGRAKASVAITDGHVVIGSPGLDTWPSDYVDAGTGRVYVTSVCSRDFVRKKVSHLGHKETVECVACGDGEEAYPGFEEKCVNCSRSICLKKSEDLMFRVSHCDKYPCGKVNNRSISQNIYRANLTVTESAPSFGDDEFYLPGSEQSYFVRISQRSASGLTTTSDSISFSLDNTSPEPGSVYDGLGSDETRNCSANTTLSSENQCSSRSFSDTDLDFTNNTASISARWIDFRDNESDIEHMFWCIGSRPLRDDIMECENATDHPNKTLTGLSLQHNDSYYVTVLVCNHAGLCTAKSSDGVLIDTTPPILQYVRDGLMGPDIDFQVFTNIIFGNWAAEDPESGIVSYEVGWGSSPGLDNLHEFQEIGNATAYYAKFKHGDLVKGRKYFVTVKAINGAGLESEAVSSNGIVVGKTEFVFSKNDSGSFFFDTMNVNANETQEKDSEVGNTFGTLDVPSGAVEDEVKFQVYSLGKEELKNGTDDNTTVVDPAVMKPPKHFKLGNYSFQIKAYEPENNTLEEEYRFKKPITISLFYDVDQMLKQNKKTVSSEVNNNDIDPVLLLWHTKNQTWFDAAKTCPEPWTFVDHAAKLLKVHVCHLTQFALFWTFTAENGIIEFLNDSSTGQPKQAITLNIVRRKGSTGSINVTWIVTSPSGGDIPFSVSPIGGQLTFLESQWNSSIHLKFGGFPTKMSEVVLSVELLNVSGGAMLGNSRRVQIVFPAKLDREGPEDSNFVLEIVVPCVVGGVFAIIIIIAAVYFVRKRRSRKPAGERTRGRENPIYGTGHEETVETSFTKPS